MNMILEHDGGNIAAQFKVLEIDGRYSIYKSGSYIADARSEKEIVKKLHKILHISGLKPLIIKPDKPLKSLENAKDKAIKSGYSLEIKWLSEGKTVEVGYRSSCGTTDNTMRNYRVFMAYINQLREKGATVHEEPIKHDNSYATNKGGFWNSSKFTILAQ